MITHQPPLIEIPDCRRGRGKRHPLPARHALACWAMLCGYRRAPPLSSPGGGAGAGWHNAVGRAPWHMAHKSHWGRDVTCDEDRSQVRCGNMPHVMAALRNTASGLVRWAGHTTIAAAGRQLAAQPAQALALIGIALENCMTLIANASEPSGFAQTQRQGVDDLT